MPDLGEQPPNNVLAAFMQYEFGECTVAELVDYPEAVDPHEAVDQLNSGTEPASEISANRRRNFGQVGFENAEGRMRQPVRQLTIVSKEEEALGVRVEPTDVEEPFRAIGDEVGQRGPALWIVHRAYHAAWLVEGKVGQSRCRGNSPSVDPDDGAGWVHPKALSRDDLPVDLYASSSDQLLTRPSATKSSLRENLLQPNVVLAILLQGYFSG